MSPGNRKIQRLIFLTFLLTACGEEIKTYSADCSYRHEGITDEVHHFFYAIGRVAKTDCVQAPDVIDLEQSRVLYSFKLPNLKKGEKIEAYAQWEMTSPMPKPMMLAWFWVLSDGPNNWRGTEITRRKGENITVNEHHKVMQSLGYHEVKDETLDHLNLVVYAASGEAVLEGEYVNMEPSYSTILIRRE